MRGAAAVPLIIGGAIHLPKDQIAMLVSADLLVCGIVTIIQCVGIFNIGIRLPMVMGVAFTAVPTIIATGANPNLRLPGVFGAVIVSGIFTYVAAPFFSRWVRFFPPVVTGSVMLIIGLSLLRVAVNWAAGGQPMIHGPNGMIANPNYGLPENLAIAAIVLVSILLMTRYLKGFLNNLAVLFGIGIGFAIAIALGHVDFGGVASAGWLTIVTPFRFGYPVFDLWSAAGLCAVMVVMMIESTGQFLAVADMGGRQVSEQDLARGLRADGVGNIIGGIFNTFTYTTFAQNVGLVQITGVLSRWAVAAGGVILVALRLLPQARLHHCLDPELCHRRRRDRDVRHGVGNWRQDFRPGRLRQQPAQSLYCGGECCTGADPVRRRPVLRQIAGGSGPVLPERRAHRNAVGSAVESVVQRNAAARQSGGAGSTRRVKCRAGAGNLTVRLEGLASRGGLAWMYARNGGRTWDSDEAFRIF